MLGLRFCARALSSRGEWGPLFIAVRGPLTIAASPVAEHRLQTRRLSSRGTRAQPLHGTWDPPRPGPEPVSPALAGRLPTTAPPGKPKTHFLDHMPYGPVKLPKHTCFPFTQLSTPLPPANLPCFSLSLNPNLQLSKCFLSDRKSVV